MHQLEEPLERSSLCFKCPIRAGYMVKSGGTGIKSLTWKRRWFILDKHVLYYYDNDSARKPKGVIDLTQYDCVEPYDTGKNNREKIFLRIFHKSSNVRAYSFGVETAQEFEEWLGCISRSIQKSVNDKVEQNHKQSSIQLCLEICEVKMTIDRNIYCVIFIDNVQHARTPETPKLRNTTLDYKNKFVMLNKPKQIRIIVKDFKEVFEINIPLEENKPYQGWFTSTPEGISLKLNIILQVKELLLDHQCQQLVQQLVAQDMKEMFFMVYGDKENEEKLGKNLIKVLATADDNYDMAVKFLSKIGTIEVLQGSYSSILWSKFFKSALTELMNIMTSPTQLLRGVLAQICSDTSTGKASCELNPALIEEPKQHIITSNLKTIHFYIFQIIEKIKLFSEKCPNPIRKVINHLKNEILENFPYDPELCYVALSRLVLDTFICVPLLAPRKYALLHSYPEKEEAKNIQIIGTILQTMCSFKNFTELDKQPYMVICNTLIEEFQPIIKNTITEICVPNSKEEDHTKNCHHSFCEPIITVISCLTKMANSPKQKPSPISQPFIKFLEECKYLVEKSEKLEKLEREKSD